MRLALVTVTLLIGITVLVGSCGQTTAQNDARAALTLNFPDSYSVNRTTGLVGGEGCTTCNKAPVYITGVIVTFSLLGEADVVYDIPLDTGEISGSLPPGNYTISVLVTTSIDITFTGVTAATLVGGIETEIVVDLILNAIPTDVVCSASNYTPQIGSYVTISCSANDLDGDTLTFTMSDGKGWSGVGPIQKYLVKP
jgi:hypothetical protein